MFAAARNANVSGGVKRAGQILVDQIAILFNPNPFQTVHDLIFDVFVHGGPPCNLSSLSDQSVLSTGDVSHFDSHGGLSSGPT